MHKVRRIICVVEATDINRIQSIEPPNILSLSPHSSISWGAGSRPSCGAFMGGILNICQYPDDACEFKHRTIKQKWYSPFFISSIQEVTERQIYCCGNGWSLELLLPFMTPEDRKFSFWMHDNHPKPPEKDMVDYFLKEKKKYDSYFALLWYFSSHSPYYSPKGQGDPREALLFIDEQIGRVLNECSDLELIVLSDHGIPPKEVSAVSDIPGGKVMLSFIASNFKGDETKSWEELGVSSHSVAKRRWL